jgi:tetratricopeptide (TPR) repeat protein
MLPDDLLAARSCLEKLVEQEPGFYPAWAHLAIMTLGEHGSGFNPETLVPKNLDDKGRSPLDRALAAALTAIRLAPSGARAYQAMMKVLLLRGSTEEAIQKGREALTRNPYDPDIMADLGSLYVRLGRPIEGLPLLERATALSVGRPPRYDFYAFLGAYLIGAKKVSETYAATLAADTSPFGLLAQALRAASDDDSPAQAKAIAGLRDKAPLFARDPRAYLARKGFAEEVTGKILTALGLDKS